MMHRLLPIGLAAIALFATACADGDGVVVSQPATTTVAPTTTGDSGNSSEPRTVEISERNDLISVQPHAIRSITVGDDGTSIVVEFLGGIGECTGYQARGTVTGDEVFVELFQGLHPNVAAMSCLAGQESHELVLDLGEPVGDRSLRFDPDATADLPSVPDSEESLVLDPADYIGLPYDDGVALAEQNGFETRLMRDGDEFFAGTADFRPDRLNFEIDDGIVTTITPG